MLTAISRESLVIEVQPDGRVSRRRRIRNCGGWQSPIDLAQSRPPNVTVASAVPPPRAEISEVLGDSSGVNDLAPQGLAAIALAKQQRIAAAICNVGHA